MLVLVAAYLGFVPVLSGLLGASTPRDLGVRATDADLASFSQKMGRSLAELPAGAAPEQSLAFQGSHPVDAQITQEELTAARRHPSYAYDPLGDGFQAKFNDDGTVEMSGTLIKRNLVPWGKAFRLDDARIEGISGRLGAYRTDPAFYVKGKVVIKDDVPSIEVEKATLGKVPLPAGAIPDSTLDEIAAQAIGNVPGLHIGSLTVEGGKMEFRGTYPDSVAFAHAQ